MAVVSVELKLVFKCLFVRQHYIPRLFLEIGLPAKQWDRSMASELQGHVEKHMSIFSQQSGWLAFPMTGNFSAKLSKPRYIIEEDVRILL